MSINLDINNFLFHSFELASSPRLGTPRTFDKVSIINQGEINFIKLFFFALDGKSLDNKPIEFYSEMKKILPRKNIGYFGLSTSAFDGSLPMETFHENGFNFGCLINKKPKNMKALVSSPFDLQSTCIYEPALDQHIVKLEIDDIPENSGLVDAIKESNYTKLKIYGVGEFNGNTRKIIHVSFTENDLLNNPIEYSIQQASDTIKKFKNIENFRQKNYDEEPWNEIIISANLDAVEGLFFSGDCSQISNVVNGKNAFRDFQLINALATAGTMSKGIKLGEKYSIKKDYDIYEYSAKNSKLMPIDVNAEINRVIFEYPIVTSHLADLIKNAPENSIFLS